MPNQDLKHTPIPWNVIPVIALLKYGGDENAQANAQFIVRACNSHDELVEALMVAIELLRKRPVPAPSDVQGEAYWDRRNQIEQALSKAKGAN